MLIQSVFKEQQPIPIVYTCKGKNIAPPLQFYDIPPHTQSLVLIMDDPDAPKGTFDHWIVWNIPPQLTNLSEGAMELQKISPAPKFGANSYGKLNYQGPCPPPGKVHHYHFKLYALDSLLDLQEGAKKSDVEQMMRSHIIEQAELIGIFSSEMV